MTAPASAIATACTVSQTPRSPERWFSRPSLVCALIWIVGFAAVSVVRGPDASWDLRNYHLYNPFALLHGRLDFDLAPAHLPTFYNPTLDLPFYWLRAQLNDHPDLLDALLSLPQSLGAIITTRIALLFIPLTNGWRWPLAMVLTLYGATGFACLSTLAISQSDMITGWMMLGGLLIALHCISWGMSRAWLLTAGLLFGIATGLKLTEAPYCIGLVAAVLVAQKGAVPTKFRAVALTGLGIVAGMALTGGWWWTHLARDYQNPVFPLYNDVFLSPHFAAASSVDRRFMPVGWQQILFFPYVWARHWDSTTAELPFRDPRFLFAFVALLALGLQVIIRRLRLDRPSAALICFFVVGYAVWEVEFSIMRYLAPLEMLAGIMIFLSLRPLLSHFAGWITMGTVGAIGIGLTAFLQQTPDWGHAARGPQALTIVPPDMAPDSLVILLDNSPGAYLALALPPTARLVGANNDLITPGAEGLLAARISREIDSFTGRIYGVQGPRDPRHDVTLAHYHLHRQGPCVPVVANIENDGLALCNLERD